MTSSRVSPEANAATMRRRFEQNRSWQIHAALDAKGRCENHASQLGQVTRCDDNRDANTAWRSEGPRWLDRECDPCPAELPCTRPISALYHEPSHPMKPAMSGYATTRPPGT